MILNRLGLNNLIEPLIKDLEFQLQDPFLLYKNANSIYGIWFYDKDECARIGQLMNSLVQVTRSSDQEQSIPAANRTRRASESDTMYERRENSKQNPVDIIQMLSKAQDEYDKSKGRGSPPKRIGLVAAGAAAAEPKPMIDNPNASATATAASSSLVKPTAIKLEHEAMAEEARDSFASGGAAGASISLQTLFGKIGAASRESERSSMPGSRPMTVTDSGEMLLKRLMSNPATTLEEIERKQREIPGGKSVDVGTLESRSHVPEPAQRKRSLPREQKPPYSPDTDLKMKLNIISSPSQSQGHGAARMDSAKIRTVQSISTQKSLPTAIYSGVSESNMLVSSHGGSSLTNVISQSLTEVLVPRSTAVASLPTPSVSQPVTSESLLTPAELSTPKSLQVQPMSFGGQPPPASPIKPVPPPANILMSPMAFQHSSSGAASQSGITSSAGAPLHHSSSAQALQQLAINMPVVTSISPPAPSTTLPTPPVVPSFPTMPLDGSGDQREINPLTREQLQQALVYLVRNDKNFMEKIHDAYVKSLKFHH